MREYFYYAVDTKENDKYYSYVLKVDGCNNLLHVFNIKNAVSITPFKTKKEAAKVVEEWNRTHKENNRYMFDFPLF